jgi:hypothetical protein
MMFWGMGIVIGMLGGLLGSVGWVATILLMFCASGRWPGTPQPVEFEPSAA